MKNRYLILIMLMLALGYSKAQAQEAQIRDSIHILSYQQEVGDFSPLFYGKEQTRYAYSINGHPYYKSNKYRKGTLHFDNTIYVDVLLRLDSYKDELCVSNADGSIAVILDPIFLESALIDGERLIYFLPEHQKNAPKKGYYLIIHEKQLTIYKRNNCLLYESTSDGSKVNRSFKQSIDYFLEFNNEFYQIKNKGSLLRILKSHKKELNRFIKDSQLNFKENPDDFLKQTISEYERINK